jgi:FkbM family methyltransferase
MSDGFLRLIVIEGNYEPDFFRIGDSLLGLGGHFFDVGANHGLFSFGLAARGRSDVSYHLFEPNPLLRTRIAKTHALYPQMRLLLNGEALGAGDDTFEMAFETHHSGASHIVRSNGVRVAGTSLDRYIAANAVDRVALLKIDIEGYELEALRGAEASLRNGKIDAVYFEYCEKWLARYYAPSELLAYLDSVGYEVCFCRFPDTDKYAGMIRSLKEKFPGTELPLVPIRGLPLPDTTDLLAVPRERLSGS